MHMRFFVFLFVCFLLASPLVAYADLIAEPENDFYERNASQIIYLGRSFAASGEDGSVAVKQRPGSGGNTAKLQNGEVVYIQYSCLYNGDYWGFTFKPSGWVKLDQMLVLYDYVAFEEEHLDEFYSYGGDYAGIKETRAALAWQWPGSEAPLWTITDLDTENFRVSHAWTDEQGREWGFVAYLYGSRDIWFCLSEPLNRDIPVFNPAPAPEPWVSDTEHSDIDDDGHSMLVVIVILVAGLAIGTIVLIKVFWKPNAVLVGGKTDD